MSFQLTVQSGSSFIDNTGATRFKVDVEYQGYGSCNPYNVNIWSIDWITSVTASISNQPYSYSYQYQQWPQMFPSPVEIPMIRTTNGEVYCPHGSTTECYYKVQYIDDNAAAYYDQSFTGSRMVEFELNAGSPFLPSECTGSLSATIPIEFGLELGDVNNDGYINVIDISMIIGQILYTDQLGFTETQKAMMDLNQDGNISVVDIVMTVEKVLSRGLITPHQGEQIIRNVRKQIESKRISDIGYQLKPKAKPRFKTMRGRTGLKFTRKYRDKRR